MPEITSLSRGIQALSLYAPGKFSQESADQLSFDLLAVYLAYGWELPSAPEVPHELGPRTYPNPDSEVPPDNVVALRVPSKWAQEGKE